MFRSLDTIVNNIKSNKVSQFPDFEFSHLSSRIWTLFRSLTTTVKSIVWIKHMIPTLWTATYPLFDLLFFLVYHFLLQLRPVEYISTRVYNHSGCQLSNNAAIYLAITIMAIRFIRSRFVVFLSFFFFFSSVLDLCTVRIHRDIVIYYEKTLLHSRDKKQVSFIAPFLWFIETILSYVHNTLYLFSSFSYFPIRTFFIHFIFFPIFQ
jgi:hypothetical protein